MTTTVSAKIPDEMKEDLEREGINVSDVIRDALEQEITERRREKLRQDTNALRDRVGDVGTDEIVDAVRETRQEN